MIPKYHLVLNLGEVSTQRRIPSYIYDELKKRNKCEKSFEDGTILKVEADYYLIQALVKEIIRPVTEYRKKWPLSYTDFDAVTGITNLNQIEAICNEDWSLEMRQRWDKMQPMMSDTLFKLRAYDKVYSFIRALLIENVNEGALTEYQIEKLNEMGRYVFENYENVKYGEVFEKFEADSTLRFPTSIRW